MQFINRDCICLPINNIISLLDCSLKSVLAYPAAYSISLTDILNSICPTQFLVFPLNYSSLALPISGYSDSILLVAKLETLEAYLTTLFLQYPHQIYPEILSAYL